MPALAAQYDARNENPVRPAIDEMLTIEPAPVAERAGNAAREQRKAPPKVDADETIPALVRQLLRRPGADDAGDVGERVEAPEPLQARGHGGVGRGRRGDVAGDPDGPVARGIDLGRGSCGRVRVEVGEHDAVAGIEERLAGCPADAACAAGDERHTVFHGQLPSLGSERV